MINRIALFALALLLPLAAPSLAHAQSIEGTWDFRVDGTTIFRFEIEEGTDGEWLGEWLRPEEFNTDGNNFANLDGGVKSTPSMTGIEFLGQVELSFDDPRPGAVPDIFRFDVTGPDSASMLYVGTDLAPYNLVRAGDDDAIGDWDAERIYRRNTVQAQAPMQDGPAIITPAGRGGPTINFITVNPVEDTAASGELEEQPDENAVAGDPAETEDEAAAQDAATSLIDENFLDGL